MRMSDWSTDVCSSELVGNARQQGLDPVDHLDDVSPRLALDVQQHGLVFVGPGGKAFILGTIDDLRDVLESQWRAVGVGEEPPGVVLGRGQLKGGRASGRERGGQSGKIWVVGGE